MDITQLSQAIEADEIKNGTSPEVVPTDPFTQSVEEDLGEHFVAEEYEAFRSWWEHVSEGYRDRTTEDYMWMAWLERATFGK
jgi:hypothetical protein